jgi:enamine deaminase RidA (YjgF/YER057c/UK114 family)
MIEHINPPAVHPPQFYSHAVAAEGARRIVWISGQVGAAPNGTVPDGIEAQTRQAAANVVAVLEGAGLTVRNLVKLSIYLKDPALEEDFGPAAAALLTDPPAATTMVVARALASPRLLVEIEAVAAA